MYLTLVCITFIAFACNTKSFAIAIRFYFFFFSTTILDRLAKAAVSVFLSLVTLGACDQYDTY